MRTALRLVGLASIPRAIVLDAQTLAPVAELDVGGLRGDVAPSATGVWITTPEKKRLSHVDGATCAVAGHIDLPQTPIALAMSDGVPLVLCRGLVVRADPSAPASVPVADDVCEIAADGDAVWVMRASDAGGARYEVRLARIDPRTLVSLGEVNLGVSRFAVGLRVAGGLALVSMEMPDGTMGEVAVDALTGERRDPATAPRRPLGIGEADGTRWIVDGRTVRRLDLATGSELASSRIAAPDTAGGAVAHGRVWLCTYKRNRGGDPQHLN
jgi:hypothetical protein